VAKKIELRLMTEIGLAVALVVILDLFKLWRAPQGGSVTLAVVPLIVVAFRHGLPAGMMAGGVAGVIKLFLGPYIIHPAQAILDYPLAFMFIGLAGLFYEGFQRTDVKRNLFLAAGVGVGFLARFACHFVTGLIFFGHYAPEGTPVVIYSLTYNLSFIIPEGLLTFVAVLALSYKRGIFTGR